MQSLEQNLKYRKAVLDQCLSNRDLRDEVWVRCARDPLWWVNTFAYTYSPKDYPDLPDRPFVLYDYQEDTMRKITAALGKNDILIEKSRDMGATWLVLAAILHRFLFIRGQSFLLGSRKQEYVDKTGDPKSLMWKATYILEHLPGWMTPNMDRFQLHMFNKDNGSTIDGESTNDNFARGDRRVAIMLDEFAAVENGHEICYGTRDATNCRIFVSTPQGCAGGFYDQRQKMKADSPDQVITMHWSMHPLKAAGMYKSDRGQKIIIDSAYSFPEDYKYILDDKVRSPWYDLQEKRAANKYELAQEVDIDYMQSGAQFFEQAMIEKWKIDFARTPLHVGEILLRPDWKHPEWFEHEMGKVKLWFHPIDGVVPKEWKDVICGVDVATGKGGEMSSNSVAAFVRSSTGEKLAEFAINNMSPSDFFRHVMGMCHWFNDAFLIHEENGPGGEFSKQLKDTPYRKVYIRDEAGMKFRSKKTNKFGWWTDKDNKKILLADYRNALVAGTLVERSLDTLNECSQYVYSATGKIEHSRSQATPDPTSSGENHGDRVIASALANIGIKEVKRMLIEEKEKEPKLARGSYGWRREQYLRKRAAESKKRVWGVFRK